MHWTFGRGLLDEGGARHRRCKRLCPHTSKGRRLKGQVLYTICYDRRAEGNKFISVFLLQSLYEGPNPIQWLEFCFVLFWFLTQGFLFVTLAVLKFTVDQVNLQLRDSPSSASSVLALKRCPLPTRQTNGCIFLNIDYLWNHRGEF